jgi:hypothetical protein
MKIIALFCSVASIAFAAERPKILIIMSDDQGYQDLGFGGSKQAITPHLDALAKSGIRCTNGSRCVKENGSLFS